MRRRRIEAGVILAGFAMFFGTRCTGYTQAKPGDDGGSPDASFASSSASSASSSGSRASSSSSGSSGSSSSGDPDASGSTSSSGEPPLTCIPKALTGTFCGGGEVQCDRVLLGTADVRMPSNGGQTGDAYFAASFASAPFTLDARVVFNGDRTGTAALFLGGAPDNEKNVCERLDALAAGQLGIVFWRQGGSDYRVALATSCAEAKAMPTAPAVDVTFNLVVTYDGSSVHVHGTTPQSATITLDDTLAITLAASLRIGLVGEGQQEAVYSDRLEVSCEAPDGGSGTDDR